jgi:hypothetical protein
MADIWDFVFDDDCRQRGNIAELKDAARSLGFRMYRQERDAERRIEALERHVDELALLCRALVEALEKKGGLTADDLHAAMGSLARQKADDELKSDLEKAAKPKPLIAHRPPRRLD